MSNVKIASRREADLVPFLELNDYEVESIGDNIIRVQKEEELPVYISINNANMYFEVDLGNVSSFASQDMYFQLLDMNTEVLPVSFGINNSNPEDPRLVLVESRETGDLNDQELLAVFDALELAVDKAEGLLSGFMK
ncbi:MAG: hypothetical protein D8M58_15955 [Calditrichaeota bacterium]|nr:MAG: hypothetical protein DWQ03_07685 [Calditrichota bacterium]MBL1206899.1 hypothetical protein [Calditrichota bacterium]NOG46725.1 hypothetical protein [Calditrichota bacterium]